MNEKGAIIIFILSMLVPFYLIFVEHDEAFILLLIEIAFLAVIGLMYVALVLLALWITNAISRLINIIWEKVKHEDSD